MDRKHVRFYLFAGFLILLPSVVFPGNFVVSGPENYTRGTGSPVTVLRAFTVLNPNTTYTLQIYNGGLTDGEFEKVSSSVIQLNGVQVVGPNEFNQKVTLIEKPVVLATNNQLSVELRGKPGGGITLQIIGVDNDPPTVAAAVNPASNAAGWHKSDVTVSFTCADATSGIAVCSSPISVTAEGANQFISGTATDLAGNSATASVSISLDKSTPTIAITSPSNGASVSNSPVKVTGTATDTLSGVATVLCNGSPATLSNSTFSCDVSLNNGPNTIAVEATDVAGNTNSSSITVNLARGFAVRITSPAPGTVINRFSVLVVGEVIVAAGTEVGVTVNGVAGLVSNGQFAARVPVDLNVTALTATARDAAGNTGSDTIPITVQSPATELLFVTPSPSSGVAPLQVNLRANFLGPATNYQWDVDGNGTIDIQGANLAEITQEYLLPGLYFPTVTVTDNQGRQFTESAPLLVFSQDQVMALLQTKWQGFKDALRGGNISGALQFVTQNNRGQYQEVFQNLTVPLFAIDQVLTSIQFVQFRQGTAEFEMLRTDERGELSYLVRFVIDQDGIWRIKDM